MINTFITCLCFATPLLAGSITRTIPVETAENDVLFLNSSSSDTSVIPTTSTPFDEEAELAKIAESCLSNKNYEEISGYVVRGAVAASLGIRSTRQSVTTIGLSELRNTLNFEPLPSWPYNLTEPNENELADAPTIQAYYNLKEPRSATSSIFQDDLYEKNLNTAIEYMDKRFPSIRIIFQRRFDKIRRSEIQVLDRKAIDRMIDEFSEVLKKVRDAVRKMIEHFDECYDRDD